MTEVEKLRRYNGLTQEDMAKLIGVTLRTYINKEQGVTQFKMQEMFIISRVFNKSLDEIFLPNNFTSHEEDGGGRTCSN